MSYLITSSQRYILETLYGDIKLYKHITILTENDVEDIKEISKVIGMIKRIVKLSEGLIVFGEYGIYISSSNIEKFERFVYYYSFIRSITGVSKDLFFKLNTIASKLESISGLLENVDIKDISKVRAELSKIDRELSVIEMAYNYLNEIIEVLNSLYPPNFGDFDLYLLEEVDTKMKLERLKYRMLEIKNLLECNEKLATSLTRLLTTLSEDFEREIANQLAKNTKYQVALGEAMEVLEVGIFGVYALEAVHILLYTSGKEEILDHIKFLSFPLEFWIILLTIILGICVGTFMIKYKKMKVLKS
ncbi:hypothetical protein [Methanocaldococcus villosus]|nr:hypothetical protein [Methanocaldococcus villosus]